MSVSERSIEDLWNTLFCDDRLDIIVHEQDIEPLRKGLSAYKHKQLKDTGDRSRIKIESTARIGEDGWYDLAIRLINPGAKTIRVREEEA